MKRIKIIFFVSNEYRQLGMHVREYVLVYLCGFLYTHVRVFMRVCIYVRVHVYLYPNAFMYTLFVRTSSDHIGTRVDFRTVLYALSHTFNIISVEAKK